MQNKETMKQTNRTESKAILQSEKKSLCSESGNKGQVFEGETTFYNHHGCMQIIKLNNVKVSCQAFIS